LLNIAEQLVRSQLFGSLNLRAGRRRCQELSPDRELSTAIQIGRRDPVLQKPWDLGKFCSLVFSGLESRSFDKI
jgi:hypothetical protein